MDEPTSTAKVYVRHIIRGSITRQWPRTSAARLASLIKPSSRSSKLERPLWPVRVEPIAKAGWSWSVGSFGALAICELTFIASSIAVSAVVAIMVAVIVKTASCTPWSDTTGDWMAFWTVHIQVLPCPSAWDYSLCIPRSVEQSTTHVPMFKLGRNLWYCRSVIVIWASDVGQTSVL